MGESPERGQAIPLGKANVVKEGSDVTLISYGRTMMEAQAACQQLETEGVSVELVDLRSIVPLDLPTVLESVSKTRRAVIAHEAVTPFGVGAELAAQITETLFSELQAPVQRVGGSYNAVPYAQALEDAHLPTPDRITDAIKKTLA
jgi:pyruvate dehydrogenase E1 component beta subunit